MSEVSETMAETFAELVRQQRQPLPGGRYRYTQYQCARKLGVHVSTWKRWELGLQLPHTPEALAFASAFRLEEEDVLLAIAKQLSPK